MIASGNSTTSTTAAFPMPVYRVVYNTPSGTGTFTGDCTNCTSTVCCTDCYSSGGISNRSFGDPPQIEIDIEPEPRMWPEGCVPIDEHCKRPKRMLGPKVRYETRWLKHKTPLHTQTKRKYQQQKGTMKRSC